MNCHFVPVLKFSDFPISYRASQSRTWSLPRVMETLREKRRFMQAG